MNYPPEKEQSETQIRPLSFQAGDEMHSTYSQSSPGSNSPAESTGRTSGSSGNHAVLETEKTVISKRGVAPPEEFFRSVSIAEYAKSLEGKQLDHFILDRLIGGGGMGAVFRGRDTRLDRVVAVKVIPAYRRDADSLRRFRIEAQSAARLDHPNIARVYHVGEQDDWNYIVFEYVEGANLRDRVADVGPLSVDDSVFFVRQVAEALQHAFDRNVVHRDIKPSNLLVTPEGRIKLVDMGLARSTSMDQSSTDMTASGVTLGTFDYISPEQARDPRDADVRSDMYSLGCTLFYMLTGEPPFPEGTALQKLLSHGSQPPPDPRQYRDDLSDEMVAILMKLMAKRPSDRYQKPVDLVSDLLVLAEIEGLTRSRGNASVVLAPAAANMTAWETYLPWLVAAGLLFGVGFWLQSLDQWSSSYLLDWSPQTSVNSVPPGGEIQSGGLNGGSVSESSRTTSGSISENVPPVNAAAPSAIPAQGSTASPLPMPTQPLPPDVLSTPPASFQGPPLRRSGDMGEQNTNIISGEGSADVTNREMVLNPYTFPQKNGDLGSLGLLPSPSILNGGQPASTQPSVVDRGASPDQTPAPNAPVNFGPTLPGPLDYPLMENAEPSRGLPMLSNNRQSAIPSNMVVPTPIGAAEIGPASGTLSNGNSNSTGNISSGSSPIEGNTKPQSTVIRRILVGTTAVSDSSDMVTANNLLNALNMLKNYPDASTIIITENQLLPSTMLWAVNKLAIKSAAGVRPQLTLGGTAEIGYNSVSFIDIEDRELSIDGIDVYLTQSDFSMEERSIFGISAGGKLSLRNCTLTIENLPEVADRVFFQVGDSNPVFPTGSPAGTASMFAPEADASSEPASIILEDTLLRGEATMLSSRPGQSVSFRWRNGLAAITGRMFDLSGAAEPGRRPPVVRASFERVTAISQQSFARLQLSEGFGICLTRDATQCSFYTPLSAPFVQVVGLGDIADLPDYLQFRGVDNAYDQSIESLCECKLIGGQTRKFSFMDDLSEWFTDRGAEGTVRWVNPVPPDSPFHLQQADAYRQKQGMFMPGFWPQTLPIAPSFPSRAINVTPSPTAVAP